METLPAEKQANPTETTLKNEELFRLDISNDTFFFAVGMVLSFENDTLNWP